MGHVALVIKWRGFAPGYKLRHHVVGAQYLCSGHRFQSIKSDVRQTVMHRGDNGEVQGKHAELHLPRPFRHPPGIGGGRSDENRVCTQKSNVGAAPGHLVRVDTEEGRPAAAPLPRILP